jgi:3-oxoacyl-[acyl-carrier protein] reductase
MAEESKKVAVVTGGSRGIGRAIIMALAEPGLTVVFNHFDPPEDTAADETIAMAQDKGCEIEGMRLDVADYKAVQEFFAGVMDRHGRVDILVNNAGITRDTLLMRMKEVDWDAVLAVNLKSVFNCTTKSVARELASRNVTVNAVAPGFIETEMTAQLPEKAKEAFLSQIPLGRAGQPEDVAQVVKFLISEEASYITGQVIHLNGGMYM